MEVNGMFIDLLNRQIVYYLHEQTVELAEGKVLRRRLHYDKATWTGKHQEIRDKVQTTLDEFHDAHARFNALLNPEYVFTASMEPDAPIEDQLETLTIGLRSAVGNMM